ncbi:transglycosylase SLT domain-containing protein [Massilia norwichensis]|uniref:Lytic transglycosylase domain-containing protein n=1 Tax=Massilia norwichensis TaxID=1442366 RepID=A0ABT2AA35_9BURK|nr:lytic transglycosylase domain-containing protein [Massilia norwichensis]MCS0591065.1 lytic transglycosylase domain-containing protein [Massilia norwichensis]
MFPLKLLAGASFAASTLLSLAPALAQTAQPGAPAASPVTTVPASPAAAPATGLPQAAATDAAREQDAIFLQLRDAARQNDAAKAAELAARLPGYAIPSYVDYYRLKPRLGSASNEEVLDFLKRYEGSAIADRLRNDWLLELGRKRDWLNFDRELPLFVKNDDYQVKCYALLSRAVKGQNVASEARALLDNPPLYGEACAALVAQLAQSGQFTNADLLAQLRLAGEMHATGPSRRTALLLGASDTRAAQAVDVPALAMARGIGTTRAEHEIYLVAVGRMARTSLKLATVALNKNAPKLSAEEKAIGWSNIALAASLVLAPEAYDYWQRAAGAPLSETQAEWKTRIALRRGDWKMVRATIEAMPADQRALSAWTYWLGRAHQAQGRKEDAQALFRRIADQNNFYGQLALEEIGQQISIPPSAMGQTAPTAAELAQMAANPGFKRALKFFSLRLRFEGTREWNWTLQNFSDRQLLVAAEYARQNEILDRMVNTSERTRTEFDYTQRFPAPHNDILHPTAQGLGLDQAWVYGLIRQESRFISDAQSGVGASGLMQVMPSTGKWVAEKIGMTDYGHGMLNDIRTNILLGTNYLNMVLNNAEGSQVLATASYNAGPGRTRTWRGLLNAPMEGAVWVETIPFEETRNYVRNVMSNATNYAALFEKRPQSLKARLGTIMPRGGTIALP